MSRHGRARAVALVAFVCGRPSAAHAGDPEEVSISGERVSPLPNDPLAATTVLRGEQLRAPLLQASELLRSVPGVAVRETGGFGALSTASVRGATSAQTPVYLSGIRLNDDVGGTADLSLVPVWLVRSVTVQRSGGTPSLDTSGLGGAIVFDPFRPRSQRDGTYELRSELSLGSFGAHGVRVSGATRSEHTEIVAGVHHDGADNDFTYDNDRGTRFDATDDVVSVRKNGDVRTTDAWAVGEASSDDERTRVRTLALGSTREQGVPGLGLFPTRHARAALSRVLVGASLERDVLTGFTLTNVLTGVGSRARYDDPDGEAGFGTPRVDQRGTRVEDTLGFRTRVGPVGATASLAAAHESLDIARTNDDTLNARRNFGMVRGAAVFDATHALALYAMGSFECHDTTAQTTLLGGGTTHATSPSGTCATAIPGVRGGARFAFSERFALSANAGRYGRVPTLGETFGINGFVRGNPDLKPETGTLVELGSQWAKDSTGTSLRAAAFVFARFSEDLIAYASSPLGYARPYNSDRARTLGAELDATFARGPLRMALPVTLLDGRRIDGVDAETRLPYVPLLQATPRVELVVPTNAGLFRTFSPYVSLVLLTARNADRAGLVVVPAQTSLDAGFAWAAESERFVLRMRATNLLDARRYDLVGYPLPGRSAYASVETRF